MDTTIAPDLPTTSPPAVPVPQRMTEDQFLALPDDGVERWLIDGQVREFGMTVRNFFHSHTMIRVGRHLDIWLDTQPEPRGVIIGGEAGIRLGGGKVIGADVAYIPPGLIVRDGTGRTVVDGTPTLVVEILSPSDTNEIVTEKLRTLAGASVPVIWKLDPEDRTVTVYRLGQPPVLFNELQTLECEPELPGFRVRVADLFGR